jgi:hypothetical protein
MECKKHTRTNIRQFMIGFSPLLPNDNDCRQLSFVSAHNFAFLNGAIPLSSSAGGRIWLYKLMFGEAMRKQKIYRVGALQRYNT